jgi:hypothetical protein
MSFTEKRLCNPTQLNISGQTLYTVPASKTSIIKQIVVTNVTGSAATFSLYIGSAATPNALFSATSVSANDTIIVNLSQVLNSLDILTALASANNSLNITVSGVENDGPLNPLSVYIADQAITTNRIADGSVTTPKISNNAVTQGKLASNLSAMTVTTSSLLSTAIPSPFEGQIAFLTDTDRMFAWNGTSWVVPNGPTQNPTGLEFIASQSFTATAASPTSINNCFTNAYNNYRLVMIFTGTESVFTSFQFLNSGGVVNGSFYRGQVTRSYGSTVDGVSSFNQSSWGNFAYSYGAGTSYSTVSCDIVSPNLNTPTSATSQFYCDNAPSSTNFVMTGGFMYAAQGIMTGFRVFPSSGSITGTVSIFGYRNA